MIIYSWNTPWVVTHSRMNRLWSENTALSKFWITLRGNSASVCFRPSATKSGIESHLHMIIVVKDLAGGPLDPWGGGGQPRRGLALHCHVTVTESAKTCFHGCHISSCGASSDLTDERNWHCRGKLVHSEAVVEVMKRSSAHARNSSRMSMSPMSQSLTVPMTAGSSFDFDQPITEERNIQDVLALAKDSIEQEKKQLQVRNRNTSQR